MRVRTALVLAAVLLAWSGSVTSAQTAGVSIELRAGSLAGAASNDGSAAAGAESATVTPTPTTPTPTLTIATPTPTPTPDDGNNLLPPRKPTLLPPRPAPTTTSPAPSPPSDVVDNITPKPDPPIDTPQPEPSPTTASPVPTPTVVDSPEPPSSPSPPTVHPGDVDASGLPSPSSTATSSPVGSPPAVPLIPDALSPSPPRPIGQEQPTTPTPAPIASEARESHSPSISSGTAGSTPSSSSTANSQDGATSTTPEYSVESAGTTTEPTQVKQYRRGDSVLVVKKQLGDGTTIDVEVVVSGSASAAVLMRIANTMSSAGSGSAASNPSGLLSFVKDFTSVLAVVTLLLLILFHFVALTPSWSASMPSVMRPNQWELLAFVTYIQAMASTAHYAVTSVPTSLWQFLDAFSWTVFIPIHQSSSAFAVKTDSTNRRLEEVIVLDGLVAFADRIGVQETLILRNSVVGLVVVCIIVPLVTLAIARLMRSVRKNSENGKMSMDPFGMGMLPRTLAVVDNGVPQAEATYPTISILAGVAVILGVIAIYPVTLLATFEVASQIRARLVSASSLAIAGLVLFGVTFFVARSVSAVVTVESEAHYKSDRRYRAVWSALSSSACVRFDRRVILVCSWLAMQFTSALVVGTVLSAVWQLVLLLMIDAAFIAVVVVKLPYTDDHRLATITTIGVGSLKAFNTALAIAFLRGLSHNHHQSIASLFIVINALVIVLWCVRQLLTTMRLLQLYVAQRSPRKNTVASSALESGNAVSPPPSRFTHSPSNAQYESTLYVALASTQEGHRGTAVL